MENAQITLQKTTPMFLKVPREVYPNLQEERSNSWLQIMIAMVLLITPGTSQPKIKLTTVPISYLSSQAGSILTT
jgi:hypothetical protein